MKTIDGSVAKDMFLVKQFLPTLLMDDVKAAWSLYQYIRSDKRMWNAFKNA